MYVDDDDDVCMYVDDDDDDDDRILNIVRVMNILCFLSWNVDFSTYDDDDDDDVSTVYATDYSITNIYLFIYHPPCCSMISLLW
jgi:hypothetical protein